MKRLVYRSHASLPQTARSLEALLCGARPRNQRAGVTGCLVYRDEMFWQCLEGPVTAVDDIYARIGQDPRHFDVEMLLDEPTETRVFEVWDMAWAKIGPGAWKNLGDTAWPLAGVESPTPNGVCAQDMLCVLRGLLT